MMRPRSVLWPEDAAWLQMDAPTHPMVVNALIQLRGEVSRSRVEQLVRECLLRFPRFRARVEWPSRGLGIPRWREVRELDLRQHVLDERVAAHDASDGARSLRALCGQLASEPLDLNAPLWRLHVLQVPGRGTALFCRLHHAIADGFALMYVLLAMCDEELSLLVPPSTAQRQAMMRPGWRALAHPTKLVGSTWGLGRSLQHLATSPRDPPSPLAAPARGSKRLAWCEPHALATLKAAADERRVTLNDLLSAAVAGGLREHLRQARALPAAPLHALVPVNMRTALQSLRDLGNSFGMVLLPLPAQLAAAEQRLAAVKRSMDAIKASLEPVAGWVVLQGMGYAPRALARRGVDFFTRKASLVLTNVRGPEERVRLCGRPIERLLFWVPQSGNISLGVSLLSFAGEVHVGVMSDAAVLAHPEELAAAIDAELLGFAPPADAGTFGPGLHSHPGETSALPQHPQR